MAWTNFEFPHSTMYDSDLRELLRMYKELTEQYDGIKSEIDKCIETIDNFDSIIDEKIKTAISNNLSNMQNSLTRLEKEMSDLQQDFAQYKLETNLDIQNAISDINKLKVDVENEVNKIRFEMNDLLRLFAEYKDSINGIIDAKVNELVAYINDTVTKLDRLSVINPFNGQYVDIQLVLDEICKYLTYGFGLTAKEYDDMQLKASEYDNLMLSASAYSMKGFFMFFEHFYLRMRSPFTGLMDTYANIINNLVALHKKSLTANMYDSLKYTADGYDSLSIDAYHYDWNGDTIAVTT